MAAAAAQKQVSMAAVILMAALVAMVTGREVPQALPQYEAMGSRFADNPLRLMNQYYELMKARRLEDAINELEQEEYQVRKCSLLIKKFHTDLIFYSKYNHVSSLRTTSSCNYILLTHGDSISRKIVFHMWSHV